MSNRIYVLKVHETYQDTHYEANISYKDNQSLT